MATVKKAVKKVVKKVVAKVVKKPVKKEVKKIEYVTCNDCKGGGLKDRHTLCPRCEGSGSYAA